jgi:hypothetical protein
LQKFKSWFRLSTVPVYNLGKKSGVQPLKKPLFSMGLGQSFHIPFSASQKGSKWDITTWAKKLQILHIAQEVAAARNATFGRHRQSSDTVWLRPALGCPH